jgi:hypothetical protein
MMKNNPHIMIAHIARTMKEQKICTKLKIIVLANYIFFGDAGD